MTLSETSQFFNDVISFSGLYSGEWLDDNKYKTGKNMGVK